MVVLSVRVVRSAEGLDHYQSILKELRARHGFVVPGAALRSILGFKTTYGWIRALKEGRVGVRTFNLEGRRGRFALSEDVARFLSVAAARQAPGSAFESGSLSSPRPLMDPKEDS